MVLILAVVALRTRRVRRTPATEPIPQGWNGRGPSAEEDEERRPAIALLP